MHYASFQLYSANDKYLSQNYDAEDRCLNQKQKCRNNSTKLPKHNRLPESARQQSPTHLHSKQKQPRQILLKLNTLRNSSLLYNKCTFLSTKVNYFLLKQAINRTFLHKIHIEITAGKYSLKKVRKTHKRITFANLYNYLFINYDCTLKKNSYLCIK